jgi:hypothetical protein
MFEIFSKSLKDTFSKKFWNYFGGSVGTIFSILLCAKNFTNAAPADSILYGIGALLIIYILRFLLFLFQHCFQYFYILSKERIYGNIIITLNEINSSLQQLNRQHVIFDDRYKLALSSLCQQLKTIFDGKTKSTCSVSIKLALGYDVVTANTVVVNFCRDKDSISRDTDRYRATEHKVFLNTCYNTILTKLTNKKDKIYYINNDIGGSKDYQSTSFDCNDGKLPYNSELVLAIIPKLRRDDDSLVGFLCIDSKGKDVFDEKYDVPIIEGAIEALFDVIKRSKQQSQKEEKKLYYDNTYNTGK